MDLLVSNKRSNNSWSFRCMYSGLLSLLKEGKKIYLILHRFKWIAIQVNNICDLSPVKASTRLFPADCISVLKTDVYIVSNPDTFLSMHTYSGAFQEELSTSPPATQNSSYIWVGGESELNMIISLQNWACRNIFNSQTIYNHFLADVLLC